MLGFLAAVASISYLVALSIPNKYTSEALLAPRADGGAGGTLGKLASQYGGIAGLAGISLGVGGEQSKTAVAIQTLLSRHFFELYLYDEVLIPLMAIDYWDDLSKELVIDPKIYDLDVKSGFANMPAIGSKNPACKKHTKYFCEKCFKQRKAGWVRYH